MNLQETLKGCRFPANSNTEKELESLIKNHLKAQSPGFRIGEEISANELSSTLNINRRLTTSVITRLASEGYLDVAKQGRKTRIVASSVDNLPPPSMRSETEFSFIHQAHKGAWGSVQTVVDPLNQAKSWSRQNLYLEHDELKPLILASLPNKIGSNRLGEEPLTRILRFRFIKTRRHSEILPMPELAVIEALYIRQEIEIKDKLLGEHLPTKINDLKTSRSILEIYQTDLDLRLVYGPFHISASHLPQGLRDTLTERNHPLVQENSQYSDETQSTLNKNFNSTTQNPFLLTTQSTYAKGTGLIQVSVGFVVPKILSLSGNLSTLGDGLAIIFGPEAMKQVFSKS